jgi:hypothetical protein
VQVQGPSHLNDFLISGAIAGVLSPFVIIMISAIFNDYPPFGPFIGLWILFAIIGTIILFIISLVIRAVQGPNDPLYSDYPTYSPPYDQPQHNLQPTSGISNQERYDQLERLDALKDKGIITEEEFQKEKGRIL